MEDFSQRAQTIEAVVIENIRLREEIRKAKKENEKEQLDLREEIQSLRNLRERTTECYKYKISSLHRALEEEENRCYRLKKEHLHLKTNCQEFISMSKWRKIVKILKGEDLNIIKAKNPIELYEYEG